MHFASKVSFDSLAKMVDISMLQQLLDRNVNSDNSTSPVPCSLPCSRMYEEFSLRYCHGLRLLLCPAKGICPPWLRALWLCGSLQQAAVARCPPMAALMLGTCQALPHPTSLKNCLPWIMSFSPWVLSQRVIHSCHLSNLILKIYKRLPTGLNQFFLPFRDIRVLDQSRSKSTQDLGRDLNPLQLWGGQ